MPFPCAAQTLEFLRDVAVAICCPLIGEGIEQVREQLRAEGLLTANGLRVALDAYANEWRAQLARKANDPPLRHALTELLDGMVQEAADPDRHATRH